MDVSEAVREAWRLIDAGHTVRPVQTVDWDGKILSIDIHHYEKSCRMCIETNKENTSHGKSLERPQGQG